MKLLLLPLLLGTCAAIDNGIGITPPRGWRSWNSYGCQDSTNTTFTGGDIITDAAMRAAMKAVLDNSRTVAGTPTTLDALGFSWISMDDGWQQCNCSTHQDIDPTLPTCSIGDCRGGKCSWHEPGSGNPIVNAHRFPQGMKSLVDYGHSLGLKVGTYLNNCICMEAGKNSPTHYEEDVAWMMAAGFDGVKIDNCGSSHNVTFYSELFNKSGKAIRIEDCHTAPAHPQAGPSGTSDEDFKCPMNMYRSGGDIKADFGDIVGEAYGTITWSDRSYPLSRPGCWAYPDMMQIGNFKGLEPTRSHEEQTHFGLWCIISSPLVLGFDMYNSSIMDRVWPTITNPDALMVNEQWAGHPGTLVKAYPAMGVAVQMTAQADCDAAIKGWKLTDDGKLVAPASSGAHGDQAMCMIGHTTSGSTNGLFTCPPATTNAGATQCGQPIYNCSVARGSWALNKNGTLAYTDKGVVGENQPHCLSAMAGRVAKDRHSFGQDSADPLSATTLIGNCPSPSPLPSLSSTPTAPPGAAVGTASTPIPNTTTFTLSEDGVLKAGSGVCITTAAVPGPQLWYKPLLNGQAAILVVNVLDIPQKLQIEVADVPNWKCSRTPCPVRDVWAQTNTTISGGAIPITLATHQSAFYILG